MKPLKLYMDSRPQEQPENTYPYGKNGIQFDLDGASFNEPGFRKLLAAIPYAYMGVIETGQKMVVFSSDDISSAIGYFNPVTELYEPIVDDNPAHLVNWPADGTRLGFKKINYITGVAQRNYKSETVIAFTDKVLFPKYLNCDKPDINSLDDVRLFPFFTAPKIDLIESLGGSLSPGTYYVSVAYERNDGTISPRSEVSQGLTIAPGELSGSTDKALLVVLTGADLNYDFMRITVISKVLGVTTAVELTDLVPVAAGTIEVLFTGDNLSEKITVAEVLTPPAIYSRIGTIGQLNDALYTGDLEKEADLNDLQPYAAMTQLEWISELIDATAPPEDHKAGRKKSFMHEEVMAFYIRYHKKRGGFTKAFHIPGLKPTFTEYNTSLEAIAGGDTLARNKFRVEDTIPAFNAGAKTGRFGIWENFVERYPDTPEFDATFLGGPNLRNQNVLHHKVPSLRWCKANLYSSVPEYGRTKLDLIGVKVTHVEIPGKYNDVIDGYEILYAKRGGSNMTIYGQGLLLHGAVSTNEVNVPTGNANIYTSGGNWRSGVLHEGKGDYDDNWELTQLRQDTFRIHPFDVILNKPSIKPQYISAQYKLKRDRLRREGYLEDGSIDKEHDAPQVHLIDYTLGLTPTPIAAGKQLRMIKNSFHLSMGITVAKFNNVRHENCFAGTLAGTNWPLANGEDQFRIKGQSYSESAIVTDFEESYVVNLMALKDDVYANFYSQKLVSAGNFKPLADLTPFWGGDTFICDYTFHTYGRHDAVDTEGDGFKGIKAIRRFVCESTSNIHLRYEIAGNEYSRWYPRTGVARNNPDQCYITRFDRSKDPNQFGYTKDLNALNDFVSSSIFNPFLEEITTFPYRVHRGGKFNRQNRPRNWRSFLPLDFYEMPKNTGRVINLEGMDDFLIIHMEDALYRTRDKAKLDAGVLSVTLGTGDIFQFEPQDVRPSKLGYGGTQHDLACVKTPIGYVYIDGKLGEMFLLNGELKNLNEGIFGFLDEYLKIKDKNVFVGNGVTIGWDQKYKRILLTVKNQQPAPTVVVRDFENTNAFFNSLVVGQVIRYQNRLVQYQGLNNPVTSGLDCPAPEVAQAFGWVPDSSLCEQEVPVSEVPLEEGNPMDSIGYSPALLQWDDATQKMYVADQDDPGGNFYSINLATGVKTYVPGSVTSLYSIVGDVLNRRIFASSPLGGLKVLDIDSGTVVTIPYGSNSALSRRGLWPVLDTVIAKDSTTGTLTIIDRITLNVIATKVIATDIPSGSTWMNTLFELLEVNGEIWVIPTQRSTGNIAVYSADLSTLITTFTLPGAVITPAGTWGPDAFRMQGFFDREKGRVYINDGGSGITHILDAGTRAVLQSIEWMHDPVVQYTTLQYRIDPVNNSLYLIYHAQGPAFTDDRLYVIDRMTGAIIKVYTGSLYIQGDLVREGATDYMWAAVPGARSWEGIAGWDTDGFFIKYAHGG
jgi:DNA-binding beta-propeller fold protein YncE